MCCWSTSSWKHFSQMHRGLGAVVSHLPCLPAALVCSEFWKRINSVKVLQIQKMQNLSHQQLIVLVFEDVWGVPVLSNSCIVDPEISPAFLDFFCYFLFINVHSLENDHKLLLWCVTYYKTLSSSVGKMKDVKTRERIYKGQMFAPSRMYSA